MPIARSKSGRVPEERDGLYPATVAGRKRQAASRPLGQRERPKAGADGCQASAWPAREGGESGGGLGEAHEGKVWFWGK